VLVIRTTDSERGFKALPRCWVVVRAFRLDDALEARRLCYWNETAVNCIQDD
jgi:hypothetical protein